MRVFRERLSVCVCASLPFDHSDGMWDLSVLISDHCLSIHFVFQQRIRTHLCRNHQLFFGLDSLVFFYVLNSKVIWILLNYYY